MTDTHLIVWLGMLLWILPGAVWMTKRGGATPRQMIETFEKKGKHLPAELQGYPARIIAAGIVLSWLIILVCWPFVIAYKIKKGTM